MFRSLRPITSLYFNKLTTNSDKLLFNYLSKRLCSNGVGEVLSSDLRELLERNKIWSQSIKDANSNLFERTASIQKPKILWIGCSDSRVPETTIFNGEPGDFFVHRNAGNVIKPDDPSLNGILEFAIKAVKVEHIILCGHSDCGAVKASFEGSGLKHVDNWIAPIMKLHKEKQKEIEAYSDKPIDRINRLIDLNVMKGFKTLKENPIINEALKQEKPIKLHAWVYNLGTGLVRVLDNTK